MSCVLDNKSTRNISSSLGMSLPGFKALVYYLEKINKSFNGDDILSSDMSDEDIVKFFKQKLDYLSADYTHLSKEDQNKVINVVNNFGTRVYTSLNAAQDAIRTLNNAGIKTFIYSKPDGKSYVVKALHSIVDVTQNTHYSINNNDNNDIFEVCSLYNLKQELLRYGGTSNQPVKSIKRNIIRNLRNAGPSDGVSRSARAFILDGFDFDVVRNVGIGAASEAVIIKDSVYEAFKQKHSAPKTTAETEKTTRKEEKEEDKVYDYDELIDEFGHHKVTAFGNLYSMRPVNSDARLNLTKRPVSIDTILKQYNHTIDKKGQELSSLIFKTAKKLGIKYSVVESISELPVASGYYNNGREIKIRSTVDLGTILHETIHAVTTYWYSLPESQRPKQVNDAINAINNVFTEIQNNVLYKSREDQERLTAAQTSSDKSEKESYYIEAAQRGKYFLSDPLEFLAELSRNNVLKQIDDFYSKHPELVDKFEGEAWDDFIRRKTLEIATNDGTNTPSVSNFMIQQLRTLVEHVDENLFNEFVERNDIHYSIISNETKPISQAQSTSSSGMVEENKKDIPEPILIQKDSISASVDNDGNIIFTDNINEDNVNEVLDAITKNYKIVPGSILDLSKVPSDVLEQLIKQARKNNYFYEYYDGENGFNNLPQEVQERLKEKNITYIPKFSYLSTIQEIAIAKEENTLINSTILKQTTQRDWARSCMSEFSKKLTMLKTSSDANQHLLGDRFKDTNFVGMTTEEILNIIGIQNALELLVKEPIFNVKKNDVSLNSFKLSKQMKLVYNNFRGFMNLCYDQLLAVEGIALIDNSQPNTSTIDTDGIREDNRDAQEISEEEGSSKEHWQIGFRSIATHKSLSQQVRSRLSTLVDINTDGTAKKNELGLNKYIDPKSAVDTILVLTQDSESLNKKNPETGEYETTSMVYKLRQYTEAIPYLRQLVDTYFPEGDTSLTPHSGFLISDDPFDEQIQSLFYSNFQKHFQNYNILYDDKGQTKIKRINISSYTQQQLDKLKDKFNARNTGALTLYNNGEWNKTKIKDELEKQVQDLYRHASKGTWTIDDTPKLIKILKFLDIEITAPNEAVYAILTNMPRKQLSKYIKSVFYILKDIHDNAKDDTYNLLNSSNVSNYKNITEPLTPLMAGLSESVSYQDGKTYYSYVQPSYLNKLIAQLSGKTENYNKFIEDNYGRVAGWFKDSEGKWLNEWLNILTDPRNTNIRSQLEHCVLLSDHSVGYTSKTPAQYTAGIMGMYFYSPDGDYAWFRIPTLGDKPSEEYVKFKKIKDWETEIPKKLASQTFIQEVNRIKAVKARKRRADIGDKIRKELNTKDISDERRSILQKRLDRLGLETENLISSFDENGGKFLFLEFLNDEIEQNTRLGELITKYINNNLSIDNENNDEYKSELEELQKSLVDRITEYLNDSVNTFKKQCAANNTFKLDNEGNYMTSDEPTLKNLRFANNSTLTEDRIREFYYNDFFAQVNIMQLTITDLAFYKNTEDLQKRLAQLHAPSIKPNVEATINGKRVSDGKFRTVYIKDAEVVSSIIPNLESAKNIIIKQYEDKGMSTTQINMLKARLNNIISQFKEVNWADAQGYTSPSAYRKRMAMYGKWSTREENAYKQILSGKVDINSLDILWQPIKPFGYSQVIIDGHNSFIPNIKMGIQNKNSEYLLIIADAILRGTKQNNKLSALYDIMEESYTKDPTKGIDAIQFESTVKTGKRSVIDINTVNTADEVKKIFNSKLYKEGQYNAEYVQEYDFQDYGIQQEVPAHFEGSQQHGSQVRILTMSDFADTTNGVKNYITVNNGKVEVKEAKDIYQNAIASNIDLSKKELSDLFHLDSNNPLVRNKAISNLLRDAIMRDSKYGPDLLWACSLNERGEFNIPLSDPCQSDRIQQLLNSVIKNRVWKQQIAGGPVVQVSSYGLSEELQIVFKDKNGNILKTREEYGKTDDEYREYLKKNSASVAHFECYASIYDESLLRDFMKSDGTVDIEKMEKNNPKLLDMFGYRIPTESKYSMVPLKIKGFLPRNAGEGIMLPKEITLLSGSDFDIDKLYIMRYEFDRFYTDESFNSIRSTIDGETGIDYSPKELRDYLNGNTEIITDETAKELIEKFPPEPTYKTKEKGRAGNNNTILDYTLGFLTSELALEQFFTPGGFEEPKRIGYLIKAVQNTGGNYDKLSKLSTKALKDLAYEKKSLLNVETQVSFHKQNMVAAQLIGAFAQGNVSHAFVNTNVGKDAIIKIDPSSNMGFKINGKTIEGDVLIDPEYESKLEGNQYGINRVSANLASYLAASVDAVKDPILNLMNINMDTVNVLIPLIRLGFDIETVGLLLSHPAVVDITNKGGLKNGGLLLKETIEKLPKPAYNPSEFNIDKKFLKGQLTRDNDIIKNNAADAQVLNTLYRILQLGKTFMSITSVTRFNSITTAVGPFITDTIMTNLKVQNFASSKIISPELQSSLLTAPILYPFLSTSSELSSKVFSNNFIQNSLGDALNRIEERLGYITNNIAKDFADFYMSYLQVNPEHPTININEADYILNEFPSEYRDNLRNKYQDNALIQAILLDTDKAGNLILTLNTRGMSDDTKEDLRNAWAELWEGDKDARQLAEDLVKYNFFRGSFSYSPKTFMHLMPSKIKLGLNNYISNMTPTDIVEVDRIIDQFLVNNNIAYKRFTSEEQIEKRIDELTKDTVKTNEDSYYEIDKLGDDFIVVFAKKQDGTYWKQIPKLGGNKQAFEIDPSKDVWEMESVVKNQETPEDYNDSQRQEQQPIELLDEDKNIISNITLKALADKGIIDNDERIRENLEYHIQQGNLESLYKNSGLSNMSVFNKLLDIVKKELSKNTSTEEIENLMREVINIKKETNAC